MKAAIIVGHSVTKQGAVNSTHGVSEFEYNKQVAQRVCFDNPNAIIVYRRNGYKQLPSDVNDLNVDLVISLHCNAFNKKASGFEILSSGSSNSIKAAKLFELNIYYDLFEEIPLRGIKIKKLTDRGGLILHKTKAPCILLEPFFIDNDFDFEIGMREMENYALRIKGAIDMYFKNK